MNQVMQTPEQHKGVETEKGEISPLTILEVSRKLTLVISAQTKLSEASGTAGADGNFNGTVTELAIKDMQKDLGKEATTEQREVAIGTREHVNLETKVVNPVDRRAEPKLWSILFQQNRVATPGMALRYVPPQIIEGQTVVQLEMQDAKEVEERWSATMIAYIVGENPGYNAMRRYITQHWLDVAEPDLFLHEDGYYVIKFQSLSDMHRIFYARPHIIRNRPIILKPWSPDFDLGKEFLIDIPLWVIFLKVNELLGD